MPRNIAWASGQVRLRELTLITPILSRQFCSAVDGNTCIHHDDTITGTVVGDEASDTTFNPASNTLRVQECLTPSTPTI